MSELQAPWTCPFCPLACDHLQPPAAACARAARSWADSLAGASARPSIDGHDAALDDALQAAGARLGAARQVLMAGLGADVAGSRALYPLASRLGALCDAAGGDALMQGIRALQDRGQFTTTLAEVRTRADLIVLLGPWPHEAMPLLADRLGLGDPQVPQRHLVLWGGPAEDVGVGDGRAGVSVEHLPFENDVFDSVSRLAAALGGRLPAAGPLQALAERLRQARYAVIVGTPALLPQQAALWIEAVHRIVGLLNASTRAAALWLGGGGGAATANQTFAWLSGLPLRQRATPRGLEHEPLAFGATRVLEGQGADALLWVSAFDAQATPPAAALPTVVLGHPGQAEACRREGSVFIPVATPGVGHAGHVFRTDGTVLMPLHARAEQALPSVAEVAQRLLQEVAR